MLSTLLSISLALGFAPPSAHVPARMHAPARVLRVAMDSRPAASEEVAAEPEVDEEGWFEAGTERPDDASLSCYTVVEPEDGKDHWVCTNDTPNLRPQGDGDDGF